MDNYLSTAQLAVRIGLAPITIAIWRHQGRGPRFCKLGSRVLYAERDVQAWLDGSRRQSTREVKPTPPGAMRKAVA